MHQKTQISENSIQIGLYNLQTIINKINTKKIYQKIIRQANRIYKLNVFRVLNMTPVKAREIYKVLIRKYQANLGLKQGWLQNQRKLFVWVVLCLCFISQKNINELLFQDYSIFSAIFYNKSEQYLKFQSYGILKKNHIENKWNQQEDNLLLNIIRQKTTFEQESKQWNQISKQFFTFSQEKYYRHPKNIRERWINHLDPHKIKGLWTGEQDLALFKFVNQNGKKWSRISKILSGLKSQHMIKNRFNSLVNKAQKQLKIINEKKIIKHIISTLQIKNKADSFNLKEDFKTSTKTNDEENLNQNYEINERKQSQENDKIIENLYNKKRKFQFLVKRMNLFTNQQKGNLIQHLQNQFPSEREDQEEKLHQKNSVQTPLFTPFSLMDKKEMHHFNIQSPLFPEGVSNFTPSIYLFDQQPKQRGLFRAMEQSFLFRTNNQQQNQYFK